MPSLKSIARRLSDRAFGTAFDRALARTHGDPHPAFLFFWNRGLGDIALGLVPLFARIRREFPGARLAVITRDDLVAPFAMADVDEVHALPGLERETRVDMPDACARLGITLGEFATVFDYPDPNRWLEGRRREFPPALSWNPAWDRLADDLVDARPGSLVIGAHVNSETARFYGYTKDWPATAWQELMARFADPETVQWILLGSAPEPRYEGANVTDLRGATDFATLVSLLRNRCRVLIAPDSGVLTVAYYLDAPFAIDVISLWSDPRQGVLLQDCASPNPLLRHFPLLGPGEDVRNIEVAEVETAVRASLAASETPPGIRGE